MKVTTKFDVFQVCFNKFPSNSHPTQTGIAPTRYADSTVWRESWVPQGCELWCILSITEWNIPLMATETNNINNWNCRNIDEPVLMKLYKQFVNIDETVSSLEINNWNTPMMQVDGAQISVNLARADSPKEAQHAKPAMMMGYFAGTSN